MHNAPDVSNQFDQLDTIYSFNSDARIGKVQLHISTSKPEWAFNYAINLVLNTKTVSQFEQDGYIQELSLDNDVLTLILVTPPCCCSKIKHYTELNYMLDNGKIAISRIKVRQDILFMMPSIYESSLKDMIPAAVNLYTSPFISTETTIDECTGDKVIGNFIGSYQSKITKPLLDFGKWQMVMVQTESTLLNYGLETDWIIGWMEK